MSSEELFREMIGGLNEKYPGDGDDVEDSLFVAMTPNEVVVVSAALVKMLDDERCPQIAKPIILALGLKLKDCIQVQKIERHE